MSQVFRRLIARKPAIAIEKDIAEADYKRPLSALDLLGIGVGGIIGAGIFVLTGKAAAKNAGPAVIVSFICSGVVCALACLCYAELGSTIPVSGSAYSFTYAALGEFLAWIVGWDLLVEYLVGGATVAVGWSAYLDILVNEIANSTGTLQKPIFDKRYINAPFIWYEANEKTNHSAGFYFQEVTCPDGTECRAIFNIPAFIIIAALTLLLVYGIRESAMFNNVLVAIKLIVVLMFIFTGIAYINPDNYKPFVPPETSPGHFGVSGIFQASVAVFFSYIGFDSVTTTAQEAANPQRDLPIGIIGSLAICTVLYIAVCAVLTGMVPYNTISLSAPVGQALVDVGLRPMAIIISAGALCGLTSVLLTLLIGQPRIFQSMAVDGLLPKAFGKVHKNYGTPYITTMFSGLVCALLAGLLPVDLLGNLTSVGTLSAFFLVSISTLVLRIIAPDMPRKFKIPGGFWFGGMFIPFMSALFSAALFSQATEASIVRVFIWMGIGVIVYAVYGYWNSRIGLAIAAGLTPEEAFTGKRSVMGDGDVGGGTDAVTVVGENKNEVNQLRLG